MREELIKVASDEFRSGLADYLEQARWNGKRYKIMRRKTPYAVVLSSSDYEFLMDSLEQLAQLRKEMGAK